MIASPIIRGVFGPLRSSRSRPWRLLPMALVACLMAGVGTARAQENGLEYAVKATYLYKLAQFIGWPPDAFPRAVSPLMICVLRDGAFAALVGRAVAGQTMDGRPFQVVSLRAVGDANSCRILFIPTTDPGEVAQALAAVRGQPVLTVTETADGAPKGIINFMIDDNRVRFEIDLAEAAGNNLAISSKLLGIAVAVSPTSTQRQR